MTGRPASHSTTVSRQSIGELVSRPRRSRASRARLAPRLVCTVGIRHKVGKVARQIKSRAGDQPDMEAVLLVRSAEARQTRDGSPFVRMTLGDRTQTLPAVLWDA